MPNPFKAITDYLTGADLKTPAIDALSREAEVKLYMIEDQRAALTSRMLVHGPGASDLGWRNGDSNSVVFSCLMALATGYLEPPLRVQRTSRDGSRETLTDHALQKLLDRPNPFMDAKEVAFWIAWAKHADGNAYLRKVRSGNETTGNVVELWPISPTLCEPVTYRNTNDFISAYRYSYAPGKWEDIPPENIVHIKLGVDDRDMRRGLAPLKRLVRLVASDDEAASFANALLGNYAMPGLVVMPNKDTTIDAGQAEDLRQRLAAKYGNEGRGNVAVLSNGATVQQFGFSPEQLNLKVLHQIPETRVCAVMRVPPAVVGVSVGLEQTSNYASMREVREMFTEQTLIPGWTLDAAKLSHGLVPDFTPDREISLAHDLTEVRALQEDVNTKIQRMDLGVKSGWILPNEARQEIGLPPLPELEGALAAQQPTGSKARSLSIKASDLEEFPDLLQAIADLARPAFEGDLEKYFEKQKRRVKKALVSGQ
jgi:HK97 family phage portal protein